MEDNTMNCKHLHEVKGFGIVCLVELEKDPLTYSTARCFLDQHAVAYTEPKLCKFYEKEVK